MEHNAIMEQAVKIAIAHANRMYPDPDSKEWKMVFEEEKHRQYYLMVTPPRRCPYCNN